MKLLLRAKNIATVFGVVADYMISGMMNDHKKPFLEHMNKMFSVLMIWGEKLDYQYGRKRVGDFEGIPSWPSNAGFHGKAQDHL